MRAPSSEAVGTQFGFRSWLAARSGGCARSLHPRVQARRDASRASRAWQGLGGPVGPAALVGLAGLCIARGDAEILVSYSISNECNKL